LSRKYSTAGESPSEPRDANASSGDRPAKDGGCREKEKEREREGQAEATEKLAE